jgi:hypothetical protein
MLSCTLVPDYEEAHLAEEDVVQSRKDCNTIVEPTIGSLKRST